VPYSYIASQGNSCADHTLSRKRLRLPVLEYSASNGCQAWRHFFIYMFDQHSALGSKQTWQGISLV
jgi:hypothetical protein